MPRPGRQVAPDGWSRPSRHFTVYLGSAVGMKALTRAMQYAGHRWPWDARCWQRWGGFIGSARRRHRVRSDDRVVCRRLTSPAASSTSGETGGQRGCVSRARSVRRPQHQIGPRRCDTVVQFAAETHVPQHQRRTIFFRPDVLGRRSWRRWRWRARAHRALRHGSSFEVYGTAVIDSMAASTPLEPVQPMRPPSAPPKADHEFVQDYSAARVIVRQFQQLRPGTTPREAFPRFIRARLRRSADLHGAGSDARTGSRRRPCAAIAASRPAADAVCGSGERRPGHRLSRWPRGRRLIGART